MKEIKNQTDFHQLMQSIDNYGKTIRTMPAYVSLEDQFMGKLLSMQKSSMQTYASRRCIGFIALVIITISTYYVLEYFALSSLLEGIVLGVVFMGILQFVLHISPDYQKEMFLCRKHIARDLLMTHQEIISNLRETHHLNAQCIESGKFTDKNVLSFTGKNIAIEEKLDMYETQKEFLESCLKTLYVKRLHQNLLG